MFDRILVPVDGTSRGTAAVEVARHLAEHFAAEVELVRVEGALASLEQVLADNRALEHQVSDLRQHGDHAHHAIEFGPPDKVIADLAKTELTQLIVMAPHHRSLLEAVWHPSVTARLLGHTAVPVLVCPEQEPGRGSAVILQVPGSLVLVPLDGSDLAEQALPYAVSFAQEYTRPLVLVRVVPPPDFLGAGPEVHRAEREYQARTEQEAHGYLTATRRYLSQHYRGLHVQSMLLAGEPWRELLRCAETHDDSLMVMSTHGRKGFQRAVLGSVTAHLVRRSPLPVLIVPPGAKFSNPSWSEPSRAMPVVAMPGAPSVDEEAALVTGGPSAIGRATARWRCAVSNALRVLLSQTVLRS